MFDLIPINKKLQFGYFKMFKKLFTFVYVVLLCLIAAVALTIGISNSSMVEFNVLFLKSELTVSAISSISAVFGFVVATLIWVLVVIKIKLQVASLNRHIKKLEKKYSVTAQDLDIANERLMLDDKTSEQ